MNAIASITNGTKFTDPKQAESISSSEKDVEYVRVIYEHEARRSVGLSSSNSGSKLNELSVQINEILKLVDDDLNESVSCSMPSQPHTPYLNQSNDKIIWIKVFNSEGITGFIPSNCVQPLLLDSNQTKDFVFIRHPSSIGTFANQIWYFGNISRNETNKLLNKYAADGDFLVRDSEREVNFSYYFIV
jgi:hypothetical protein